MKRVLLAVALCFAPMVVRANPPKKQAKPKPPAKTPVPNRPKTLASPQPDRWTAVDEHYVRSRFSTATGLLTILHWAQASSKNASQLSEEGRVQFARQAITAVYLAAKGAQAEQHGVRVPAKFQEADVLIANSLQQFVSGGREALDAGVDNLGDDWALAAQNIGDGLRQIEAVRHRYTGLNSDSDPSYSYAVPPPP